MVRHSATFNIFNRSYLSGGHTIQFYSPSWSTLESPRPKGALLLVGLEHTVGPARRFFGFKHSQLLSGRTWEYSGRWEQSHGRIHWTWVWCSIYFPHPSLYLIIRFPNSFMTSLPLRLADRWLSCIKRIVSHHVVFGAREENPCF